MGKSVKTNRIFSKKKKYIWHIEMKFYILAPQPQITINIVANIGVKRQRKVIVLCDRHVEHHALPFIQLIVDLDTQTNDEKFNQRGELTKNNNNNNNNNNNILYYYSV